MFYGLLIGAVFEAGPQISSGGSLLPLPYAEAALAADWMIIDTWSGLQGCCLSLLSCVVLELGRASYLRAQSFVVFHGLLTGTVFEVGLDC